jgi:Rps23 Pro-64 3,4-dihydroxylase Tpa1-like proline 4-hydroxylase
MAVLFSLGCCVTPVSSQQTDGAVSSPGIDNSTVPASRTFQSFKSKVHVIPNFLPQDLAIKWRDEMRRIWENTRPIRDGTQEAPSCDDTSSTNEHDTFLYASNNDGTYREENNNAKLRSLEKIGARNIMARIMESAGFFSYTKWELPPNHALVKEMEEAFSKDIRETVRSILKPDYSNIELNPELSDLFATLYSTGDFLSSHDDGTSGSWAFVVSLMDGPPGLDWNPKDFGGGLQFECPHDPQTAATSERFPVQWCENVYPTFNSAVIFPSRLNGEAGPIHQVLPVTAKAEAEGFYRFGLTGWYMDATDVMDEFSKQQRDMMRARD